MYGKIHVSFFDSSIADADPMTRFIFIGMIVLSDQHGRIDVTPMALARRLNVSREDVDKAIDILSRPDPLSRSSDHGGSRVVPIDPARSWGWIVVNKKQYRSAPDPEVEREQNKERNRRYRARQRGENEESNKDNSNTYTGETQGDGRDARVTEKLLREWFEIAWGEYPKKKGRAAALNHYRATVQSEEDRDALLRHLANYKAQLQADRVTRKYVMNGSTWFNNWRDEEYASPPTAPHAAQPRPEGSRGVVI